MKSLKVSQLWDVSKIEDALIPTDDSLSISLLDVPQLEPETPDFETLRKRFDFWFGPNNTDKDNSVLDEKIHNMVEMQHEIARSVKGISKDELDGFNNPASSMVGFNLNDEKIMRILQNRRVCPEGFDFDSQLNSCKENKLDRAALTKRITRNGEVMGGEIILKSDLPTPPVKCKEKRKNCRKKGGKCVPKMNCDRDISTCKASLKLCSKGCVCQIKKRTSKPEPKPDLKPDPKPDPNPDFITNVNVCSLPILTKCHEKNGICVKDCLNDKYIVCEKDACRGSDCVCKLCKQDIGDCKGQCVPDEICNEKELNCNFELCGKSCSCAEVSD